MNDGTQSQTTKHAWGRPTNYTQELADNICEQLAMGKSMRTVCKEENMPCVATIFNWMRTKPEFLEQYTRAKEESADAMAEEVIDISDDGDYDIEIPQKVARDRLRIETRKWLMSKMKPKKYSDKIDVTSGWKELPTPIISLDVLSNNRNKESS